MNTVLAIVFAFILLLATGCKDRQESAFDDAVAQEKRAGHAQLTDAVRAFEQVVALDPASPVAGEAKARIAALKQRIAKGEETHRDVFQEHGVD